MTIICYEIFKFLNKELKFKKRKIETVSSKSKITKLVKHLINLLVKRFFCSRGKKHSMILNIHNLIYRLEPNDKELRILASIFSALSKNKDKAQLTNNSETL